MKTKKIIAIDLETIANPAVLDFLPEVKPSGTLKDPKKIAADIAKKQAKQITDMGMSPLTNIICCTGWWDSDGNSGAIMLDEATDEAEKDLLLESWALFEKYGHFVTFNGRSFDLRCLLLHGVGHGIRPSVNIDKGRYNRVGSNHTDLRGILAGEDKFAPGKLDFFAKKFLGDHKTEGIDGGLVQGYYDLELFDEIKEYCIKDTEITYRLFEMVKIAGLLE